MSSYLVAIIFGACAFFALCTLFLLISDIVKFQKSMNAAKSLARSVRDMQDSRKRAIKDFLCDVIGYQRNAPDLQDISDEIYEKEVVFYKSTIKILQDKSFSSIENFLIYVDSLLAPYYKLKRQGAPLQPVAPPQAIPAEVASTPAPSAEVAPVQAASAEAVPVEAASTEADAQVQKSESIEDQSGDGASTPESGSTQNAEELLEFKQKYEAELSAYEEKINHLEKKQKHTKVILENVFKAYMAFFGKESFAEDDLSIEAIEKTVAEMQASGAKPVAASSDGEISGEGALLEQLKFEKVELMNKFDNAMKTLNKVYKEYAAAFGMDNGGANDLTLEQIKALMGDDEEDGSKEEGAEEGAEEQADPEEKDV